MTARGTTTYTYNGDGTLVSQASGGVTTLYTQDLAASLSQILQTKVGAATRTDYLYGLNRLASLNGSKHWQALYSCAALCVLTRLRGASPPHPQSVVCGALLRGASPPHPCLPSHLVA
jgi:hypothetical protein